jgi:hypothetical protein
MREILNAKAVIEFQVKCPHCDDITYAYDKNDFECIIYHGFICQCCRREYKVVLENYTELDENSPDFPFKSC